MELGPVLSSLTEQFLLPARAGLQPADRRRKVNQHTRIMIVPLQARSSRIHQGQTLYLKSFLIQKKYNTLPAAGTPKLGALGSK